MLQVYSKHKTHYWFLIYIQPQGFSPLSKTYQPLYPIGCVNFVLICCSCWKLYRSTKLCTIINIKRLFQRNKHCAIAQEKWGNYGNSYQIKNWSQSQCNKFKQLKSQWQFWQVRIFVITYPQSKPAIETGLEKEWKFSNFFLNTCVKPA